MACVLARLSGRHWLMALSKTPYLAYRKRHRHRDTDTLPPHYATIYA